MNTYPLWGLGIAVSLVIVIFPVRSCRPLRTSDMNVDLWLSGLGVGLAGWVHTPAKVFVFTFTQIILKTYSFLSSVSTYGLNSSLMYSHPVGCRNSKSNPSKKKPTSDRKHKSNTVMRLVPYNVRASFSLFLKHKTITLLFLALFYFF